MKYSHPSLVLALFVLISTSLLYGENVIPDPHFEQGIAMWVIFIPEESNDKNCQFRITSDSPHSGTTCAQLQSDQFARFGISPKFEFQPKAGERYHIIVWVKADPTAEVQPDTPGIVIRITLTQKGKETSEGHYYLGLNNVMSHGPLPPSVTVLPKEWTKLEGDFIMPNDADKCQPTFFAMYTKGSIFFDDISIEKVDRIP